MGNQRAQEGWYLNPHDRVQERYWDGTQWTEQTRALELCPLCRTAIANGASVCGTCGARATAQGWVPAGVPGLAVSTLVGVRRTNGMAIASLVLGILYLCSVGSVLALVFGYIARKQINESEGTQTGLGMATAGVILGWIGVGLTILYFGFLGALVGLGTSQ